MINYMYFPRNKSIDEVSAGVISSFNEIADKIDSDKFKFDSNEVLSIVRLQLEKHGFKVETGKKQNDKILIPVLYGKNGRIEKSFEVDAYSFESHYVVEVEAGRAVTNYQFLKDFFEACTMININKLCIAVRNVYNKNNDFDKVCTFFETLYSSKKFVVPLDTILIIGY